MKVTGDAAAGYDAIRLDSMETVNKGVLVEADSDTGHVVWKDSTDSLKEVTLGDHRAWVSCIMAAMAGPVTASPDQNTRFTR